MPKKQAPEVHLLSMPDVAESAAAALSVAVSEQSEPRFYFRISTPRQHLFLHIKTDAPLCLKD